MICIDGSLAHHWLIDSPSTEKNTCTGFCRRCEARKEFPTFKEYFYGEDGAFAIAPGRGKRTYKEDWDL